MEPVLIDAYRTMLAAHPTCSVDRIIEYPQLRAAFLALVRPAAPDADEGDVFHGLNNLRKKSRLPRRSA